MDKGNLAEWRLQRPHDGQGVRPVGEIDTQHTGFFGQRRERLTLSEAGGERAAEVQLAREGSDDEPLPVADQHALPVRECMRGQGAQQCFARVTVAAFIEGRDHVAGGRRRDEFEIVDRRRNGAVVRVDQEHADCRREGRDEDADEAGKCEPQYGLKLEIGWPLGVGRGRAVPPLVEEIGAREQFCRICTDHDGPLKNDPKRCAASPRIMYHENPSRVICPEINEI